MSPSFSDHRKLFHKEVFSRIVRLNEAGTPNFADAHSATSSDIATRISNLIPYNCGSEPVKGQSAGKIFEELVMDFIKLCFGSLNQFRPGNWAFERNSGISIFEQYSHLKAISAAAQKDMELGAVLGSDYLIKPDIVVMRTPESDGGINKNETLVDESVANLTPIRKSVNQLPLLHASISCKWTMRSDRSQNTRTEALNLIRNRKGRVPHIVAVTAEPLPSRIASISLGTGDIDCTYHFALTELMKAVQETGQEEAINLMNMMVKGKRLRDIADLPFDLAI